MLIVGTGWLLWRISRGRPVDGAMTGRRPRRRRSTQPARATRADLAAAHRTRLGRRHRRRRHRRRRGAARRRRRGACGRRSIEQDDIAAGTSSRSSRLIHGGLRYLEQFQFGLVREALAERRGCCAMAPHLVTHRAAAVPDLRHPVPRQGVLRRRPDPVRPARRAPRRGLAPAAVGGRDAGARADAAAPRPARRAAVSRRDGGRRAVHAGRRSDRARPPAAVAVTRVRATGLRTDGRAGGSTRSRATDLDRRRRSRSRPGRSSMRRASGRPNPTIRSRGPSMRHAAEPRRPPRRPTRRASRPRPA